MFLLLVADTPASCVAFVFFCFLHAPVTTLACRIVSKISPFSSSSLSLLLKDSI